MLLAARTARAKAQSQSELSTFQQGGKWKQESWEVRSNRRKSGTAWEVDCANHKSRLSHHRQSRENGLREVLGGTVGALKFAEGMGPGGEDRDQGINEDLHRPLAHSDGLGGSPSLYPGKVQGTPRVPRAEPRPLPSAE